jgi:hypothetical protein
MPHVGNHTGKGAGCGNLATSHNNVIDNDKRQQHCENRGGWLFGACLHESPTLMSVGLSCHQLRRLYPPGMYLTMAKIYVLPLLPPGMLLHRQKICRQLQLVPSKMSVYVDGFIVM